MPDTAGDHRLPDQRNVFEKQICAPGAVLAAGALISFEKVRMSVTTIKGIIIEGHRVASAPSGDYPYGTLEKQKPYFKTLGLSLEDMYDGTLNVSIHPNTFKMRKPEYTFEHVEWTDLHPPETFSFSRCTVIFRGKRHAGWVYYPHPETKERHFQQPSMIEILAAFIPGIQYGAEIEIELNREEIQIIPG